MIDILGLLYGFLKDAKDYLEWDEEIKIVDRKWLEKSGFEEKLKAEGYKLRWSNIDKIELRVLDGYEFIYEIDKIKRVRKKIQLGNRQDSSILLGIKVKT